MSKSITDQVLNRLKFTENEKALFKKIVSKVLEKRSLGFDEGDSIDDLKKMINQEIKNDS